MNPRTCVDQLLIQEVAGELVVYDLERQEAHRLNSTAALVFRHCDGQTSISQLADLLHAELGLPTDTRLVWDALIQLDRAQLIEGQVVRQRHSTVQKVALVGALALLVPVVESLVAPTPAAAFSF